MNGTYSQVKGRGSAAVVSATASLVLVVLPASFVSAGPLVLDADSLDMVSSQARQSGVAGPFLAFVMMITLDGEQPMKTLIQTTHVHSQRN